MQAGRPVIGSIKVLDHLDREIECERVYLDFNDSSESYEIKIVTRDGIRTATIVDILDAR